MWFTPEKKRPDICVCSKASLMQDTEVSHLGPDWRFKRKSAGRGSSIGNVSAWHAIGPEFFGGDLVMKKSTSILPLPLIQEEQLSVTGERMCTKYW